MYMRMVYILHTRFFSFDSNRIVSFLPILWHRLNSSQSTKPNAVYIYVWTVYEIRWTLCCCDYYHHRTTHCWGSSSSPYNLETVFCSIASTHPFSHIISIMLLSHLNCIMCYAMLYSLPACLRCVLYQQQQHTKNIDFFYFTQILIIYIIIRKSFYLTDDMRKVKDIIIYSLVNMRKTSFSLTEMNLCLCGCCMNEQREQQLNIKKKTE